MDVAHIGLEGIRRVVIGAFDADTLLVAAYVIFHGPKDCLVHLVALPTVSLAGGSQLFL